MATKKITLNELKTLVKKIINEEMTDNTLKVELFATSSDGGGNPKSRENIVSYRKIQDSLKNNVPVQFTVRYITEKGSVTADLVNGVVKPVSRGKDDFGNLRPAEIADIKLFSNYGKKQNYEGQETISDMLRLIQNFSHESTRNFIKQTQQQPVSEGVKKITMSGLRDLIKEEISKGK
jgi:hypothetical protein